MANVLGSLFSEIAGAIREKTGTSEPMAPNRFPEKIRGISATSGEGVDPYYLNLAETLMVRDAARLTGDGKTLSLKGFIKADGSTMGNLPAYSFAGFRDVENMVFSDVIMVNEYALRDCGNLKILDITAGGQADLIGIAENALSGCASLETVILRSGGTALRFASVNLSNGANDTFCVYVPAADYDAIVGNLSSSNVPASRYRKLEEHPAVNFWSQTFTVKFYDGDTLVDTKTVRYGQDAASSYRKEGKKLIGWTPEPVNVTQDMDCYGSWAPATFGEATWAEIDAMAQSGVIGDVYAVGDTKDVTLTYPDGTTEDITLAISDFGGYGVSGGTAGLGLVMAHALKATRPMGSGSNAYAYNTLATWLNNDFYNALPEDLRTRIKGKDITGFSVYHKCWVPSLKELNVSNGVFIDISGQGMPLFASDANRIRKLGKDGAATAYWTRTIKTSGSTYYYAVIKTNGTFTATAASHGTHPAQSSGVVVGMCL